MALPAGSRFVLDTSALLAMRGAETGAPRVEEILRAADAGKASVFLSFMTRMEILYRVAADEGPEAAATAIRLLDAMTINWVSCDADILDAAAKLKAAGGLSVADAWIAATAKIRDAVLVHKDPEFARATDVAQERIAR